MIPSLWIVVQFQSFLFRSPLLEKIEITTPNWNCQNINSTSTVAHSNLQNLKLLKLNSFHVKSDYLERMLTGSKKIEHLEIKDISLGSLHLSSSNLDWPKLQRLVLRNTGIGEANFKSFLQSSVSLNLLSLYHEKITDGMLSGLRLRSIDILSLGNLTEISNRGLNQFINQLTNIEALKLYRMPQISQITNHSVLSKSKRVQIEHSLNENAIRTLLEKCTCLDFLWVNSIPISVTYIGKVIEKNPHLKMVTLKNTSITKEQMDKLKVWFELHNMIRGTKSQCIFTWEDN